MDSDDIEEINDKINFIINTYKSINTKKFRGFYIFPTIPKYKWNKYLLVGIIRSYFDDYYEIENTSNTYDTTEFIIRRKRNSE